MSKSILGHIDCPTCGGKNTMRITQDKNGQPFGYCAITAAACRQQLRIGGDDIRVESFLARYPWAAAAPENPVTVTVTAPAPMKKPVTVTTPAVAAQPVPVPVRKKATFADALSAFGGAK